MADDYRERLTGTPRGIPDLELRLATEHPPGVLEAYHVALDTFNSTIQVILSSAEDNDTRTVLETALHGMIAGTAIYAYRSGIQDSL